jgi:hypothetical protein
MRRRGSKRVDKCAATWIGGNEEMFDRIMNDPALRNLASEQVMREVYERLRNREPRSGRA